VSFETDALGDFHDYIDIKFDENMEPYKLYLHAFAPGPDIQFEPLVNFWFIPINTQKEEYVEFKNEGWLTGNVKLEYDNKTSDMQVDPVAF